MPDIQLSPISAPFHATLSPPGSKSLTNRALVIASMAEGQSRLSNVLFADDTEVMLDALTRLGYVLNIQQAERTVTIQGGDIPSRSADLFCGNSGTTLRFLAAAVSRGRGTYRLDGVARMRQRPLGKLGELLTNLGVPISYELADGYPPVIVQADTLPGGRIAFGDSISSQYLSAILMVAPYARHEVRVDLEGKQSSWPYVAMTMRLMDIFGHTPELERDPDTHEPKRIVVPRGSYTGQSYAIEPDASNSSYFLAAAALHEGASMTIQGLDQHSLQGDVEIATHLGAMGAEVSWGRNEVTVSGTGKLVGVDLDLTNTPDLAQTLAVTAVFASGPTTLRGLHTLRVKETDRVEALRVELGKLGAGVEVHDEEGDISMTIRPPARATGGGIATYDDHRMAMSFALAGTRVPGVVIRDAECCSKTYPEFFSDFANATNPSSSSKS